MQEKKGVVIIKTLTVSLDNYNYNIYVGKNLFLEEFFLPYKDKKLFIITDSNVYKIYENFLKESFKNFSFKIITVKEGEQSKSFEVYNEVINKLLEAEMKKDDLIVSFGGGVVGDLAGFIAGTIFRGVKFVNIPTTLLSMSDSSIGGKTGIDTSHGKNLVGMYKQPLFVVVDISYLRTLKKEDYSSGMAEIIKAGLIADKGLIELLLSDFVAEEEIILKALNVKKEIVEKDPYENSLRMLLNFGHTFGHAIEQHYNYELKHGFCVGLGMDLAIRFGIEKGLTNKEVLKTLEILYDKYNLKMFEGNANKFVKYFKYDKKHRKNDLYFIILKDIGKAERIKVSKEALYDLWN